MSQAKPDFSRLPVTFSEGISFPLYCLFSVVAAAQLLGGLALMLTETKGLFLILFGGAVFWSVNRYGPRSVTIDRTRVEARETRFFRYGKSWTEPLSSFRGVALGGPRGEDQEFFVELQHDDNRKNIVLYDGDAETSRKVRNEAARNLNIPVIEGGGVTQIIRSPEDIDTPLSQPGKRAPVHTAFDRAAPKPHGISSRFEGGGLWINIRLLPFSFLAQSAWTAIYALLAALFWEAWPALGLILLILVGLVSGRTVVNVATCVVGCRRIEITETEVRFFYELGPFHFRRRNLSRSQIVSVEARPNGKRLDDVLINAPDGTIEISALKRKTAAWLINLLRAAITRGPTAVT